MIINKIYSLIDEKINRIEEQRMKPSVIIVNASLFRQMQQEFADTQLAQAYGKVRSPYSLSVYKGCTVHPSEAVETAEVF